MRKIYILIFNCALFVFLSLSLKAQKVDTAYKQNISHISITYNETLRQIGTLADDSLRGRGLFNGGAMMASNFIENEYKSIGLEPSNLPYTSGFIQSLPTISIGQMSGVVVIDNDTLSRNKVLFINNQEVLNWNSTTDSIAIEYINENDNILERLNSIETKHSKAIIVVETLLNHFFHKYTTRYNKRRIILEDSCLIAKTSYIMILKSADSIPNYNIQGNAKVMKHPVNNLIGMIEGKSLKDEYIIFSAHYDNIGYTAINKKDSIANGADENASGVAAVLQLAKYFKEKGDNERTLLFVNYGAEDQNSLTSKFFASNIETEKIIAVINIDAIGKESAFRERSAYITGYNKDNLGKYFTNKGKEIKFKFKSDPYTTHNLFYRAANTPLGVLGVPSHTFSTIRIDRDRYINSVRDDMNTIELDNMIETIKAIAFASEDLVNGSLTPSRIIENKKENSTNKKQKRK
jgi:hypothetical protein